MLGKTNGDGHRLAANAKVDGDLFAQLWREFAERAFDIGIGPRFLSERAARLTMKLRDLGIVRDRAEDAADALTSDFDGRQLGRIGDHHGTVAQLDLGRIERDNVRLDKVDLCRWPVLDRIAWLEVADIDTANTGRREWGSRRGRSLAERLGEALVVAGDLTKQSELGIGPLRHEISSGERCQVHHPPVEPGAKSPLFGSDSGHGSLWVDLSVLAVERVHELRDKVEVRSRHEQRHQVLTKTDILAETRRAALELALVGDALQSERQRAVGHMKGEKDSAVLELIAAPPSNPITIDRFSPHGETRTKLRPQN